MIVKLNWPHIRSIRTAWVAEVPDSCPNFSRPNLGMARLPPPKFVFVHFCDLNNPSRISWPRKNIALPKYRDPTLVCPKFCDQDSLFPDFQENSAAIFATKAETARQARLRKWRNRLGQTHHFQTFQEKISSGFRARPRRRRRDFRNQGGDGRTFATKVETARPIKNLLLSYFSKFSHCQIETARLSRPKWRRRDF